MALKATVFKIQLAIADMDRGYYQDHVLTLARHPSETDERMLVRTMAFALNASDALVFGKGLSTDDEPALWRKDLTGNIELWIDVGQPTEKWLRKACGVSRQVLLYLYGGRSAELWWRQTREALAGLRNLTVAQLRYESDRQLMDLVARNMALQVTVQESMLWLTDGAHSAEVTVDVLQAPDVD